MKLGNSQLPTPKKPKYTDANGNAWSGKGKRPGWLQEKLEGRRSKTSSRNSGEAAVDWYRVVKMITAAAISICRRRTESGVVLKR